MGLFADLFTALQCLAQPFVPFIAILFAVKFYCSYFLSAECPSSPGKWRELRLKNY